MKKTVRTIMFIVAMTAMMAGCQKDITEMYTNIHEKTEEGMDAKREVDYIVNGEAGRMEIVGDDAWIAFLHQMVDFAENGYTVTIGIANNPSFTNIAKETVTYTTADKDDAVAWADTMTSNGYIVDISYDSVSNLFVCVAYRK